MNRAHVQSETLFKSAFKFRWLFIATIAFAGMISPLTTLAEEVETLGDAFTEGKFGLQLRWRAEYVDDANFYFKGLAIPLRTRLNYGTADWHGLSAFVEYDYVFDFGVDTYNEGGGNTPDRTTYPVIADPSGGDLNQAYLQYKSRHANQFRLGRQRLNYDNQRFVGSVGWRMNEQTFDSFAFQRKNFKEFEFQAAYLDRVHRIFGDDVPAGEQDMKTWLFNVSRTFEGAGKLVGYYYDIDNKDAPGLSNRSWGLRFNGDRPSGNITFGYGIEYANQGDSGNNPVAYDADYWRLDFSVKARKTTFYAGYESLGGDNTKSGQAFRTPLATLHAFNGWADKFLTTPDDGLTDLFIGVKGKLGTWNWNVLYHDFDAEAGSTSFGREIDASIGIKLQDRYGILFKTAWFDSRNTRFSDTSKVWVMFTADF